MPTVTRTMIKAGMAWLVLSLTLRLVVASGLGEGAAAVAALGPVWWHMLAVGWLTQLIVAVAWWMFPTLSREKRRGEPKLMWAVAAGLNLGLLARAVGEPAQAVSASAVWEVVLVVSAVLQWLALLGASVALWPRVRAPRTRRKKPAKAKKEAGTAAPRAVDDGDADEEGDAP